MVEALPVGKYGLDRMMCTYGEDRPNYSFDSTPPGSASTVSSSSRSSSNDDGQIFVFPTFDGADVKMPQLRKSVNKLGGMYTSGKPLPLSIRREIVAMSETGMKACDISRQLQISHGCVSKIIAKWRSTGSFEPRRIGGSKPKKTLPEVISAVRMYKRACPSIHSLEIRKRLLADEICTDQNVPSLSSINRIIRMKLRDEVAEFEASAVRDLMAILTGPSSTELNHPGQMELKQEEDSDSSEESTEYDEPSPIPPPQPYAQTPSLNQPIPRTLQLPLAPHPVEKSVGRPDLISYFATMVPPNGLEFSSQMFESLAPTPARVEDRRHHGPRMPDLFADPYEYPLGTPIFNDPNMEMSHHHPSEPKMRPLENPGLVFGFDFEENVWSWLDQMPMP